MPRYIDADKLIKTLFPLGLIDDGKYTINAKAVKYAIDNTPTADVVPRAELDAMRGAANSYKMHYEKAKTDIEHMLADLKKEIHDKAV